MRLFLLGKPLYWQVCYTSEPDAMCQRRFYSTSDGLFPSIETIRLLSGRSNLRPLADWDHRLSVLTYQVQSVPPTTHLNTVESKSER